MRDWNTIVTVADRQFARACKLLEPLGPVQATHYYNTLVMRVEDTDGLLETMRQWMESFPDTAESLRRVVPLRRCFNFNSVDDFHHQAAAAVLTLAPLLAGKSFHVRLHRRGWKSRLHSTGEEQDLGGVVYDELERLGTPGRIEFKDPDAVIDIETVDNRAGLACWTRQQLERYPFLRPD